MQIELMGCTGAGKSTMVSSLLEAWRGQGMEVCLSDEVVLKQIRLERLPPAPLRRWMLNLVPLIACLISLPSYWSFCRFALRLIVELPVNVWEKLYLARNVLRKVGVYDIVRRHAHTQAVLVDEGTLQAAHNLFVHVAVAPSAEAVSTFMRLAPLPDAAIYVAQPEALLIERTLQRGHPRLLARSPAQVTRFIRHALATFDQVIQDSALTGRLLRVSDSADPASITETATRVRTRFERESSL